MLVHLYRDLHDVVYHEISSLGVGITLLHIWAWEHLLISRPMCLRFRAIDQLYVYMYGGMMTQPRLGKLEYWRRALDELDIVIWHPYRGCKQWEDNAEMMPSVFMGWFLIGRTTYVIERHLSGRVMR